MNCGCRLIVVGRSDCKEIDHRKRRVVLFRLQLPLEEQQATSQPTTDGETRQQNDVDVDVDVDVDADAELISIGVSNQILSNFKLN